MNTPTTFIRLNAEARHAPMTTFVIGDVHGKMKSFLNTLQDLPTSCTIVQLGDFGLGFDHPERDASTIRKITRCLKAGNKKLYLMRGNHDNPKSWCVPSSEQIVYVKESAIFSINGKSVLMIPGGTSLDRKARIPNRDWWEKETIDYAHYYDNVPDGDIDVVISHVGCRSKIVPPLITKILEYWLDKDLHLIPKLKTEEEFILSVIEDRNPKMFVGGHFHVSSYLVETITTFRHLNELETIELI